MKSLKYLIKGTNLTPFTLALAYLVFGIVWFYSVHFLLNEAFPKTEVYEDLSFVIVTALLMFIIIKRKGADLYRVQEQLRAIIRRVIKNKEADSEHIANQLQNEFNQELAAIKIQLTTLRARYTKNPNEFDKYLAAETEAISTGINNLIYKFRKFTEELRPEVLEDLDLRDSIDWLVSDNYKRTGIKTVFSTKIEEFKLEKKKSVNVFRILQEAIIFLDDPDEIEIKAAAGKKTFIFTVSFFNNRKELFPIAQHEVIILGLRERIAMISGDLMEIKSEKGLFLLSFYVPKTDT